MAAVNPLARTMARVALVLASITSAMLALTAVSWADGTPTFQRRYAPKQRTIYTHLLGTTHIRDDFYNSYGLGLDAGYYPSETWGLELRLTRLRTRLSSAARGIKEETGLTPDARPQRIMATAGARASLGYGKVLLPGQFLVHFDPQIAFHSGIAMADRRVLPTALLAPSLLLHFKWGLQVRIDLSISYQAENRDRGWVSSFGFMPSISVGRRFARGPAS